MFYLLNFIWICPVVLNQLYVWVKVSVHKPEKENQFYLNYIVLKMPSTIVKSLLGLEILKQETITLQFPLLGNRIEFSETIFST